MYVKCGEFSKKHLRIPFTETRDKLTELNLKLKLKLIYIHSISKFSYAAQNA